MARRAARGAGALGVVPEPVPRGVRRGGRRAGARSRAMQQLVALPGQVGLDDALRHVAAIFGIKAVHLLAEAVRGHSSPGRLGAALERRARARGALAARQKAGDGRGRRRRAARRCARRNLVVDAAPRVVVEGTFGVVGAAGALRASPFQAVYFVAHEALLGQVVGAVAAALAAAATQTRQADDDAARAAWAAAATAAAGEPPGDAHLRATAVALGRDAELAFNFGARSTPASSPCSRRTWSPPRASSSAVSWGPTQRSTRRSWASPAAR